MIRLIGLVIILIALMWYVAVTISQLIDRFRTMTTREYVNRSIWREGDTT